MSYHMVIDTLDTALSDQRIQRDLSDLLIAEAHGPTVVIEIDDQPISVPIDAPIDIVTKAFFKEYYADVGFGEYKVLIALGGFQRDVHGLHTAHYCFVTLYYNNDGNLITADFHGDLR